MLLYKFRSLEPWDRVRDLLERKRLYCPRYQELNDPFEGQLRHFNAYPDRSIIAALSGRTGHHYTVDVSGLPGVSVDLVDRNRVCSLSAAPTDVRMWSLYADSHRGIAVEIEKKLGDGWAKVSYSADLPSAAQALGLGQVDEAGLRRILSSKTRHWRYEREWRILSDTSYFACGDRIRRVVLGHRCTEDDQARLIALAPDITFVRAFLSRSAAEVIVPSNEPPPLPIFSCE